MVDKPDLDSPVLFDMPDRQDEFAARYPEQVRILLAMLRLSRLGGIAVAECDDLELRERLFEYFKQRLADEGIYLYLFEVSDTDLNLVRSLRNLTDRPGFKDLELIGKFKGIVIFIYGMEKYTEEQQARFLYLLNFLRDAFTLIEQPVVIWGTSDFITKMARHAPDFWSWKGMLFTFPSPEKKPLPKEISPRAKLPPFLRYIYGVLEDPEYAIWRDLYLPLKAKRAVETVRSVPLRRRLTAKELASLSESFPEVTYGPGEVVFHRGERGTACYIIKEGQVEILVPDPRKGERVVTKLSKGDFFGEIALLQEVPRTATVRTTAPSQFIVLKAADLEKLASQRPSLLDLLERTGQRRMEALEKETSSPLRRLALRRRKPQEMATDVLEMVSGEEKTAILGEAGAGKTTVLRRLMLKYAEEAAEKLQRDGQDVIIPVFVELSRLGRGKKMEELILEAFHRYGVYEFQGREDLSAMLKKGSPRFLFLLDGLNEIPKGEAGWASLFAFLRRYPQHRFVVTCRTQAYRPLRAFLPLALERLSRDDIRAYLIKYLGEEKGQRVADEVLSDPQLTELGQTPLVLYMFAQIAKGSHEALPRNRGLLFQRFIENLMERTDTEWWKIFGRSKSRVSLDIRRSALARLGFLMQKERVHNISRTRWERIVRRTLQEYRASGKVEELRRGISVEDVFEELLYSSVIRLSTDRRSVEFIHPSVQEYFAALALRERGSSIAHYVQRPDKRRQWRGVLILLFGISPQQPKLFRTILGSGEDYDRIWLAAECLANAGINPALVESLFRSVRPRERAGLLFSLGLAYRESGRYTEALACLHEAVKMQPTPFSYYELGSLYRQMDQHQRAIEALEEAIRLKPDFVDAYNQLGITYYERGQHVEALTLFQAAAELEPDNPYHYYNLGHVYKTLKRYDEAMATFRRALELKPDYKEARLQLEILEKVLSSGAVAILERIPLLSRLTLEQFVLVSTHLSPREYDAGEVIFHQGEIGDTFYIIEEGQVEVVVTDSAGREKVINRLGEGDFFGEIALLRAVPRTATVRTLTPARLLALSRKDFEEIVSRYPAIADSLEETSSHRLLQDRRRGSREMVERYYDASYIEELIRRKEVTVLIGDIHRSTALTAEVGPELMVRFLDEFYLAMSKIIVEHGGAIDRSLGDSVMGIFGPSREDSTDHAFRALAAACRMREAFLELCQKWGEEREGFRKSGLGLGLCTGKVVTGTVGSERTTVGPPVNIAAKLSKIALRGREESEIYVDERTRTLLGKAVEVEALDPVWLEEMVGDIPVPSYRIVRGP